MVFKLKAARLELKLRIMRIDDVLIHEEIVPELLDELIGDIKQSKAVKDPVVIDGRSRVVLDGMHRVAALKELGCTRIPVCEVDYQKPAVKIGCWYRVIKGKDEAKFSEILHLFGLKSEECSVRKAKNTLARRKAIAAFLLPRKCMLVKGNGENILEIYTWVKRIELALREEGFRLHYEHEDDAQRAVGNSAVLMVPCVTKKEVMEIATAGHVFAHKTTRHMIPARPLNVHVPLEWLKEKIPLAKVNRMLEQALKKKKTERLPPGSVWKGRRYEEETIVFR